MYKYITYFIFYSLISIQLLDAQTLFNERYNIAKGAVVLGGVEYYNNTYFITGGSRDSTFYIGPTINNLKVTIFNINQNGNKLWGKRYGRDSLSYNITGKSTPSISRSSLYFTGVYFDTYNKAHQYLFKFNEQGDSLLLKHYFENDTTAEFYGGNCKIARDDNLMLCGVVDSSFYGKASQMYLMKTDTFGNIIWEKSYGNPGYESCTNMDTCSDGGFILGGWRGSNAQDPYMVKTDSNGVFMWDKLINTNYLGFAALVMSTKDGGILVATTEKQLETGGNMWTKLFFNKYDINGNLLWRRNIGDTLLNAKITAIEETSNGDIVALANGIYYNLILKLNSNGDSLLMEQINWVEGQCSENSQYGFDLALIDNGGYAVAGFIIPSYPASGVNNSQDAWLSTYDSLGCQLPNAPYNLIVTTNIIGSDTIIDLNWQYNSTNPNQLFVVEEYLPEAYGWDIRNDECLLGTPLPFAGSIGLSNTQFTDTISNKAIAIYRVFAVDTLTHLTSCHSNIAIVDFTVSINEMSILEGEIKIYPNPTTGVLTLEVTNFKKSTLKLFTITGKQILSEKITQTSTQINLSNYPKGIYFYQLLNENERFSGKIVVQ